MLLSEIGRFGDGIEGLKPSDIVSGLSENVRRGMVGVFWHIGNGKFLIKKCPVTDDENACVEMGQDYDEDTNPDDIQIDYNHFHKDIWHDEVVNKFPELKDFSWDHFSRGRIILNVLPEKYGLYIPKSPNITIAHIRFLLKEFELTDCPYEVFDYIYKRKKDMDSLTEEPVAVII